MTAILKNLSPLAVLQAKNGKRRMIIMVCSILLMGFGISVFSFSDLGVDPYTAMNMAVSAKLGIGFGFYQMLINGALLLAVAFCSKKLIGIGTVVNMIGVGYVCEFFTKLYDRYLPAPETFAAQLFLMAMGVVLLSFAASLFFTASLGVGPYDAAGFVFDEKTKIQYKWCRVITDLVCTAVAIAFAGPVGIGTIVTAFCMGPVVTFFNKAVSEKLLYINVRSLLRLTVRYYDFRKFGAGFISPNGRFVS